MLDEAAFWKRLEKFSRVHDDDELWQRYLAANGKCEICKESGITCFDHCHSTGYFRGFLCGRGTSAC